MCSSLLQLAPGSRDFSQAERITVKGKAPVVPFHEITSLYSYFEEI